MAANRLDEDPFDSVVFIEDRIHNDGYRTGYSEGLQRGHNDGYKSGCEKGEQIGEEVGFYYGFTQTLLTLKGKNEVNTRLYRLASGLHESILTFNILNINEENYIDHIQQMRSKYKQIASILKITTQYHETSSFNF